MKKRMQKAIKRAGLTLLILTMLFGLSSILLEAGACEDAFFACTGDLAWMNYLGTIYCGNGYLFCKKYLEAMD